MVVMGRVMAPWGVKGALKVQPFGAGSGNGADDLDPSPTNTNGFAPDTAHQPDLSYIAYLTTGDSYYLGQLEQQANFGLLDANPDYRNGSQGLIDNGHGQLRGQAWDLHERLGELCVSDLRERTSGGAVQTHSLFAEAHRRIEVPALDLKRALLCHDPA